MSECVVRMEMPTLEKGCKIAIGNEYMFCQIEAKMCNFYELGGKCPSWCPIICSLPEGHGRLTDADEFLKRAIGTKCFNNEDDALMLEQLVGESITIVSAEARETLLKELRNLHVGPVSGEVQE